MLRDGIVLAAENASRGAVKKDGERIGWSVPEQNPIPAPTFPWRHRYLHKQESSPEGAWYE